jgi:predicted nucleotidyltransferase component of viral defense system
MQSWQRHDLILKQILRRIFQDNDLVGRLAFKGGTCLYLFYDLPRFSVDLDFDLLPGKTEFPIDGMTELLSKNTTVIDQHVKEQTYFWLLSYEKGQQKIKVEINRRYFPPNKYQPLDFYGIYISTMTPACMMAHKLCAITDRLTVQNRDLYDSYFMLEQNWEPDTEIIRLRTGLSVLDYYQQLITYIEHHAPVSKILDGLGQLLADDQQRQWVKVNLHQELIAQLKMRL